MSKHFQRIICTNNKRRRKFKVIIREVCSGVIPYIIVGVASGIMDKVLDDEINSGSASRR